MKTNNTIKVTPSYSARTFTIRANGNKYLTGKFSKEAFESNLLNTENDWKEFLKSYNDYFLIK